MGKEKPPKYKFNDYRALEMLRGREIPRKDTKTRYLRASCAPVSYAFLGMDSSVGGWHFEPFGG
jgi:hypothetical protein